MVDPIKPAVPPAPPVKPPAPPVKKVPVQREPSRCQNHAIAVAKKANMVGKSIDEVLGYIKEEFDISDRLWEERVLLRTLAPETELEVEKREAKEKLDKAREAKEAAADAKVQR
jgi:hypothetical protein